MLHAYFVLKKRLQRIQSKNADFLSLLISKFPFLDPPQAALLSPSSNAPAPLASPAFSLLSPRSISLLSPRVAARLASTTSASAASSLSASLFALSTRCLRLHLYRNQPLVAPGDLSSFVYLVQSGSLVVQRPSAVATECGDDDEVEYREFHYTSLKGGDDVGLYDVVVQMSDLLLTQQRRERRERARARAEEEEWERIKLRGGLTREQPFLRSKKNRDRDEAQRAVLTQPVSSNPSTPRRPHSAKDDPLHHIRRPGPVTCRVVAREPSVLYAVPRWAMVECLQQQVGACMRMRRWMEERERWREQRWQVEERVRCEDERRRVESGARPRHLRPTACVHRFRSWQSGWAEERVREKEWRERCRREEEKKKKMEEAMLSLNHTSKSLMEAVDGAPHGLGWIAAGRSRAEEDAAMAKVRHEAELLRDAMNKRAILSMFRADRARDDASARSFRQLTEELNADVEDDEPRPDDRVHTPEPGSPEHEVAQARPSIVLPRLRLELVPAQSPITVESTDGEVVASGEATSMAASPMASVLASPFFSAEPSPTPSDLTSPADGGAFVFPRTPTAALTLSLPSTTAPTSVATTAAQSPTSIMSPTSTMKDGLTRSSDSSPPSASTAAVGSDAVLRKPWRPSTVALEPAALAALVHDPPPPAYLHALVLSMLSSRLPPLIPSGPPRRPSVTTKLIRLPPTSRPLPSHPRHRPTRAHPILRLRSRITAVLTAEQRQRVEAEHRRQAAILQQLRLSVRQRVEEERRRVEEEGRVRMEREREEKGRAEEAFNFVNVGVGRGKGEGRKASATFITQQEGEEGDGEVGGEGEGKGEVAAWEEEAKEDLMDERRRRRRREMGREAKSSASSSNSLRLPRSTASERAE